MMTSAAEELDKSIKFMTLEKKTTKQQIKNLENIGEVELATQLKGTLKNITKYLRDLKKERNSTK